MKSPTIESLLAPGDSIEFENGQWSLYSGHKVMCRVSTLAELHAHLVQRNGNAILVLHRLARMMKKHDAYVRYNGREFEFREDEDGEIVAKSENLEDLFEKNSYVTVAQVMEQLRILYILGRNESHQSGDTITLNINVVERALIKLAKGE